MSTLDPTQRFSSRVDYYVKSRPRYPASLLRFCQDELGLRAGSKVADVGSGTGFLSELFLRGGCEVFGVEPNDPMRGAAEKYLAGYAGFHSVNGRAEATTLESGSMDFVVAGQAFHWFDRAKTREEFERILRPEGWVVLAWNDRQKTQAPGFSAEYDKVIKEFQTDLKRVSHADLTSRDSTALDEFFGAGVVRMREFENPQELDLEGVVARALSSSYLPLPGEGRCAEMLERLKEIVARWGENGRVVQGYTTKVYYGHLASQATLRS